MALWRVVAFLAVVAVIGVIAFSVEEDAPPDVDPDRSRPVEVRAGDAGGTPVTDRDGHWLNAVEVPGVSCDGDAVDDLQAAVDRASTQGVTLVVPQGSQCRLDTSLEIPDGTRIQAGGAEIAGLPGSFRPRPERESLVDIIGASDVKIHGGVWRMARDEGANVFEIRASSSVVLAGLTATGAREDGFYIGRPPNAEVSLDRVLANENGRSGISITTGRDIHVLHSQAHDNGHVLDMRGLAIEPTSSGGPLTGIRIVDLETYGNARSGAALSLGNLGSDSEDIDIVFEDYRSIDEPVGLRVSKGTVGGSVRIVDAQFHRTTGIALQLKDVWASAFDIDVVRPVIRDWGGGATGRPRHDSAISIYTSDDDVGAPLGGVRISDPTITASSDAGSEAYYVFVGDNRNDAPRVENVEVLNPVLFEHGRGLSLEGDVRVGATSSPHGLSLQSDQEEGDE